MHEKNQAGLSRRAWPAHVEGIVPQLFDDHQGSRAGDESTQGIVSGLGHSLCRDASLRTALSFGMARQDPRSRRAPAGRTLLPTTRRLAAGAPTSPERAVGRGEEAPCDEVATADSWYWSASAAHLVAVMQTPHRFRTKRQLWNYSGLGLETHDSAQYRVVEGQLQRSRKPVTLRGLNDNHNHDLKDIFKGAAMRASTAAGPLHDFYEALLAKGRKPTMARLTLARKIAAITLIVWKKEVRFDANYLKQQAA